MEREARAPARAGGSDAVPDGASWPQRCEALFKDLQVPARAMVTRAYGRSFSEEEIEDIYSAAWAASLAALRDRGAKMADEELRAYIFTAVASHAGKEMRRRSRKPSASLGEAAEQVLSDSHLPLPDEVVLGRESRDVARDLLASLPLRRRAVMLLRYGWGLSPAEVCERVEGLSPRAYRKEITRGVEQLIERLGRSERGGWCASREPLIRDLVAGLADEDTRRQAHQHLRHCRGCAGLARRLRGELHALDGALVPAVAAGTGGWGLAPELAEGARAAIASLIDQVRAAVGSLVGRGEAVVGAVAGSGAGRGTGAAGSGLVAKLAGAGGAGKVALACAGAGAAATACVAVGVVPGVGITGVGGDDQQRPHPSRVADSPPRLRMIDPIGGPTSLPATPGASKAGEGDDSSREGKAEDADSTGRGPRPEDDHPSSLPAGVREFDPVIAGIAPEAEAAAPAGDAVSVGRPGDSGGESRGGGGSAAARNEFGP